ncbi:hypothetical protein EV649_4489 [Kribbella sp. VKM Ac-2569]|uniref:hypothetical protein n=1 Tax=Kribbella sp. VKM Ac-2569 TaxID=2512220 RepID=UPI00102ACE14|nr:hypothetical protein [Kribbella sp. VKM Ac-2569]RZT16954.1 hypothetical protein EV649_4489 [Kribbella sp. VKM Ac-2569]
MNTELEPPRVPPLSAAERSRMRNQLMERTRPATRRPARHWVAPMVGVGAVAAVVAGTLVVTQNSPDEPGAAGTSASLASPEARVGVDLGAVPQGDVAKIVADCQFPGEGGPAQLVWSRHVRGITKDSSALVALALNTKRATAQPTVTRGGRKPGSGGAPSTAKLGYRYCMTRIPPSAKLGAVGAVGRVEDKAWQTEATAQRGLVALGTTDGDFTNDLTTLQAWRLYRAHPDVAKVEARYVLGGKTGPWTSGVVDGGFAYIEVQANGKFTVGQRLKTEVRAFDAQGRPVPVG